MARILVIDDDRVQRLVAAQALRKEGHDVIDAIDGITGLEAVRAEHPDLVVCDVLMPGMNGYQFVTALREEEAISGIPVIMLTSMAERSQMRAGMTAGADDYIAKPFSFQELNEAVDAQLAKRRRLEERLISSMSSSLEDALEEQRESLAARYEKKLVEEIGGKWGEKAQADTEVRYEHAIALKVQLAATLVQQWASLHGAAAKVRTAHDAIRDGLHLFNAAHLLPAGNDAVAIYVDEPGSVRVRANVRAVRAALALLSTLSRLRGTGETTPAAHVSLHCGTVAVLRISDPLHGGPDSVVATGAAMHELDAIADFGRAAQWSIVASPLFVGEMAGQLVTGRKAQASFAATGEEALDVIEVLSLR
jgi:DNA-binding response OmpR family regulator